MWAKLKTWFQNEKVIAFIAGHEKTILGPLIVIYVILYFWLPTWSDNFFIIGGAIFWLLLIYCNQTVKGKMNAASTVKPPVAGN